MGLKPFIEKVRSAKGEVRASPLSVHPSFD